jgi:hypothetical protein
MLPIENRLRDVEKISFRKAVPEEREELNGRAEHGLRIGPQAREDCRDEGIGAEMIEINCVAAFAARKKVSDQGACKGGK